MSGLLVLLATDLWHFLGTSHSSSGEAIDTSNLSMGIGVDSLPLMGLESVGSSGNFLDDFLSIQRLDCHYYIFKNE